MKFTIVGINIYEVQEEVEWLEVATDIGSFVVQEGYVPTLFVLSLGKDVLYKPLHRRPRALTIQKGILKVDRESATLLVHTQ